MNDNNDLEQIISGLRRLTAHVNRLTNTRMNPGQHEQVRYELQQRGMPALTEFQTAVQQVAQKYFPKTFQQQR